MTDPTKLDEAALLQELSWFEERERGEQEARDRRAAVEAELSARRRQAAEEAVRERIEAEIKSLRKLRGPVETAIGRVGDAFGQLVEAIYGEAGYYETAIAFGTAFEQAHLDAANEVGTPLRFSPQTLEAWCDLLAYVSLSSHHRQSPSQTTDVLREATRLVTDYYPAAREPVWVPGFEQMFTAAAVSRS